MNKGVYKYFLIFLLVFGVVVFDSCKKKSENEETKPSIEGDLAFSLPNYGAVNSTYELWATGITTPTEGVKYQWICSGIRKDTVTTQNVTITIPDSLATYTITLIVSAEGYYGKSVNKTITSVDASYCKSLTDIPDNATTFTDSRDNKSYGYVTIGSLDWMSENLEWAGAGIGYARVDIMGDVFGRYYTWKEATGGVAATGLGAGPQGVCPDGWAIPTNEDWEDLAKVANGGKELSFLNSWSGLGEKFIVNAKFNGNKVWPYSPNVNVKNEFNWNALPSGNAFNSYYNFENLFKFAFWWSSTEKSTESGYYRYINYNYPDFPYSFTDKNGLGLSIRCVRLKR